MSHDELQSVDTWGAYHRDRLLDEMERIGAKINQLKIDLGVGRVSRAPSGASRPDSKHALPETANAAPETGALPATP